MTGTAGEIRMRIRARLEQAYRDMAAADLERLMALYAVDAVIQSPGEPPIQGLPAIRAFWQATFALYRVELVPEIQEVTELEDVVVIRGQAHGRFLAKNGGSTITVHSWFMQIYRKPADGTLLFWRGANGPLPPAPPSAE